MFLVKKIQNHLRNREIYKEKEAINRLRQQNASVPISLLPDDILQSIFLINAPEPENQNIDFVFLTSDRNYHTTLAISRVCFVWRHAALSCALLWSRCLRFNVNTKAEKFQKRLEVLLLRSHPCTIDINMGGFGYCYKESFDAVLTCTSRIKTLEMCVDQAQCQSLLNIIEADNMPCLENFSVSLNYRSLRETPNLPSFTIKGSVFTHSLRLRRFSCQNFGFDLNFPPFVAGKLVSLYVGAENPAYSHFISHWLHALTSMQELQILCIKEQIQDDRVVESTPVICLPRLSTFFIMCYNHTHTFAQQQMAIPISKLLGLLHMPNICSYDLRIGGIQSDQYFDSIVKHFKQHIQSTGNTHLILELDDDSLCIRNSLSASITAPSPSCPHFRLEFYPDFGSNILNVTERTRRTFSLARDIIPVFNDFLFSTTNFKLTSPCIFSQHPSRRTIEELYSLLFSSLPNAKVCEISIIDSFLLRTLCAFLSDAEMYDKFPAVPALETLTFCQKLIFSDNHSSMYSDFLSMLQFRTRMNSQFTTNLYNHLFLPEQWGEMKELGFVSDTSRPDPIWGEL